MPEEKSEYYNKYLDARFANIDASINNLNRHIDTSIDNINNKIDTSIDNINNKIDTSIDNINNKINDSINNIDKRMDTLTNTISDLKGQFIDLRKEVKQENRSTRWWIVGTAITVLVGFAAIAVAIFFGFSQLQTAWIQSAFSLAGKVIR